MQEDMTIIDLVDTLSHVRAKVDFLSAVFTGGNIDYISGNALSGISFVLEDLSNDVESVETMLQKIVREG